MLKNIIVFALGGFLLIGCGVNKTAPVSEHAHEYAVTTITQWTDDFELYAEIAPIVVGDHVDAIIHLTRLSDYKPVTDGTVSINFVSHAGDRQACAAELTRPGIYIAHLELDRPDLLDAQIIFHHHEETTFDIGHIRVFEDAAELEAFAHADSEDHDEQMHHDHSEEESDVHTTVQHNDENDQDHAADQVVTFLKEQQWKTDFATALVEKRRVVSSIVAVSEVAPHQHGYAQVVAPVDGLLLVEHNQEMVVPGKSVREGDQLLVLCPPIGESNSWLDRQLEYERAKLAFERAEKLLEREAISRREYEDIKQTFTLEQMNYQTVLQNFSAGELQVGSSCLLLRAPIGGVVADVTVLPGQKIAAGERLLIIIDPSIVWIRSQLYEKDIDRLGEPAGLSIRLHGTNRLLEFGPNDFELLSTGLMLDVKTRTIPVVFKVRNPGNQLKIGQVVQTEIHTTQSQDMPAVPASAVLDEEIENFVFVQTSGESFEKRSVQTGATFGEWIAISSGLEPGERVVTKGAYAVKLASANVSVGHAHVH